MPCAWARLGKNQQLRTDSHCVSASVRGYLCPNQSHTLDCQGPENCELRDISFLSALAVWASLSVIWFRKKMPSVLENIKQICKSKGDSNAHLKHLLSLWPPPFQGSCLHSVMAAPFIIGCGVQVRGDLPLIFLNQFVLIISWPGRTSKEWYCWDFKLIAISDPVTVLLMMDSHELFALIFVRVGKICLFVLRSIHATGYSRRNPRFWITASRVAEESWLHQ